MLDELVQLIQINIGEKLAGQVADRQTLAGPGVEKRLMRRYGGEQAAFALDPAVIDRNLEMIFSASQRISGSRTRLPMIEYRICLSMLTK